jgi:CDP-glycerol glycerophosphotransferase (TagB/SpsB family)
MLLRLENRYRDSPIEWDYSAENLPSLSKADIMISDYSGIIFDFAFLFKKPVLFSNAYFDPEMYDASDLDHEPWKFTVVREFGVELKDNDIPLIREKIEAALEDRRLMDVMEKARDTAWQHIGESGEKVADFLIAKQKTLTGHL